MSMRQKIRMTTIQAFVVRTCQVLNLVFHVNVAVASAQHLYYRQQILTAGDV